ncbi:unnamed protein product [Ectocarpus sp. 6 AP-2014]
MDTLMEEIVNGVKQFCQWVSNPFEVCCCPGRSTDDEDDNGKGGGKEGGIDLWHKDNHGGTTCVTTPAEGRVVVHGGLEKRKDKKTGRLTAEALRSLNPSGLSACGGHRPAASHSSGETLDNSSQHSGHSLNNSAVGIRSARNGASKRCPSHGVRFSSGVDVIAEWDLHLASVNRDHKEEDGRGTATITLGGVDVVSVAEDPFTGPRRSFAQAPRSSSRAARFAIEYSGGGGGGGGNNGTIGGGGKGVGPYGDGQPLTYGMKDIIASGDRGIKGIKGVNGSGLSGEEEEGDEEEDEAIPTLLDRYDGSLASLKSLVFPPSITDRPVKRLFDASVLASTSPAKSMTATELDVILGRLSGWKHGGGSRRRAARRATRTRKSAGCGSRDKSGSGADSGEEGKLRRVSSDNSALRAELFALARGERRESLLFKRAFLNAEGGSVSSRQ